MPCALLRRSSTTKPRGANEVSAPWDQPNKRARTPTGVPQEARPRLALAAGVLWNLFEVLPRYCSLTQGALAPLATLGFVVELLRSSRAGNDGLANHPHRDSADPLRAAT